MMPISAVIIVKNEEERIRKAVLSAKAVADEVIVIDDHSCDRTQDAARGLGARVLERSLKDDFGAQRNFGASVARNDWVLMLDADEELPPATVSILRGLFSPEITHDAFSFRIINVLFGKPLYHSSGQCRTVRLYRRSRCSFSGAVHEKLGVPGTVGELAGEIWNHPMKDVDQLMLKVLRYTETEAERYCLEHATVSSREVRRELLARSLKRFWKFYVKNQGYKDGLEGLLWSVCNCIGPQIRWMKIYDKARKAGKIGR
jgi:glycosyltransferase involved in cell wall biosynthesis